MTRASKYQDHYPELLLETLKDGHTIYSFAAKVGVSENTLVRWRDRHPEFGEVWGQALMKSKAAWDDKMVRLANGELPASASAAIIHAAKTRLSEVYGDRPTKLEHTGKNGLPIATVDLTGLSDEELALYGTLAKKVEGAEGGADENEVERSGL